MDTGEDDLLKTALSEAFNFIEHIGKLPASHPASGVRDDAVTAELVAAVLHFNIGSRVLCRVGNFQLLVLFLMGQILEVIPPRSWKRAPLPALPDFLAFLCRCNRRRSPRRRSTLSLTFRLF